MYGNACTKRWYLFSIRLMCFNFWFAIWLQIFCFVFEFGICFVFLVFAFTAMWQTFCKRSNKEYVCGLLQGNDNCLYLIHLHYPVKVQISPTSSEMASISGSSYLSLLIVTLTVWSIFGGVNRRWLCACTCCHFYPFLYR